MMIFDSERARELCAQYAEQADYRVPHSVFLARCSKLAGERAYLEGLISTVSDAVQRGWVSRLLSEKHDQHLAAWFEMMLYGWLREIGSALPEPEVLGEHPDFLIRLGDTQIIVEAKTVPIMDTERERDMRESELCATLDKIERPFVVTVKAAVLGEPLDVNALAAQVTSWLDHSPVQPFLYDDAKKNRVLLHAERNPDLKHVATIATFPMELVSPGSLRGILSSKAKQHKEIRKAGYPYVLAIMPESWKLSAEEVVAAWFGNEQIVIDFDTNQVVEQRLDQTGIHYFRHEVIHKSVSGTLVFKRDYNPQLTMHQFKSWYVQNPYANAPLDSNLFPVQSKYIVIDRTDTHFRMGWQGTEHEQRAVSE